MPVTLDESSNGKVAPQNSSSEEEWPPSADGDPQQHAAYVECQRLVAAIETDFEDTATDMKVFYYHTAALIATDEDPRLRAEHVEYPCLIAAIETDCEALTMDMKAFHEHTAALTAAYKSLQEAETTIQASDKASASTLVDVVNMAWNVEWVREYIIALTEKPWSEPTKTFAEWMEEDNEHVVEAIGYSSTMVVLADMHGTRLICW